MLPNGAGVVTLGQHIRTLTDADHCRRLPRLASSGRRAPLSQALRGPAQLAFEFSIEGENCGGCSSNSYMHPRERRPLCENELYTAQFNSYLCAHCRGLSVASAVRNLSQKRLREDRFSRRACKQRLRLRVESVVDSGGLAMADAELQRKPGKVFVSFLGGVVVLILTFYAGVAAVEEYYYRVANSETASAGLKINPGRRINVASLLRQAGNFGVERKRSRKLAGVSRTEKSGFKVKMQHRNSVDSPFRKTYSMKLQALREDMAIDATRLAAFQKQRIHGRDEIMKRPALAKAANPPAITAVIEGPPSHDYDFTSPVVSGSSLGSGQYFVDFFLGTPPQKFSLIVDSGSDLLWVQCAPCRRCYEQDSPLYSPANSSTFAPVPCLSSECLLIPATEGFPCDFRYPGACAYEYRYGDSSSSKGVFAHESATLDGTKIDKVAFGCGSDNQGSFAAAGGVLGLGQGPLSFGSQVGYAYGNKFAYCLVNYLDPTSVSSSLIFGDELISTIHDLQFTPMVSNSASPTLYYVQIKKVTVGGEVLSIPESAWSIDFLGNGGSIFDSGTTVTYWVPAAYRHVLAAFEKGVHYPRAPSLQGLDLCVDVSGVDQPSFPSFSIELEGGALFQPQAENYFVDVAPNVQCLAMAGLPSSLGGFNTIGNLLQQNFLVQYDREEYRIGFAPAKCSSHS